MNHFERLLGHKKYVEAITRADIDDYKVKRSVESSSQHDRPITARTINFEVGTLRTFFYYLINDRGLPIANPCARFKRLKDEKKKAHSRPQPYTQEELDRLFAACDEKKKAIFATLLLTGLRKRELYFLTWRDVDLKAATIRVNGDGKEGFSPKDYEERIIPIPPDLVAILEKLPKNTDWVFTNYKGGQISHLLRRLKEIGVKANVSGATLHKFRHTYATRLLEGGCDIVTLQHLMGHSDIETTRQYLNPHDDLKRQAVSRLSLNGNSNHSIESEHKGSVHRRRIGISSFDQSSAAIQALWPSAILRLRAMKQEPFRHSFLIRSSSQSYPSFNTSTSTPTPRAAPDHG
jgi:integrase